MTGQTWRRSEDAAALADRVDAQPWSGLLEELDAYGCAAGGPILTPDECAEFSAMWDDTARFRATVEMARYRYGEGTYRYFAEPVPEPIMTLRAAYYRKLLPLARSWAERLGDPAPWPDEFAEWLDACHAAGQRKPTPILLRYTAGDWNALHRDLYGDLVFPLQVVIGLDRPGTDHTGGEFLIVEQRPRAQSKATVSVLEQGHALIFTTRDRPIRSSRGWSRAPVRHGVSRVRSGLRHTLGLVLHDAE
ncbi:2OG-Fe(II) oxygenase [Nocardia sp. NBC_00508]|uniref:2OG-Fe(II) oxygenase n=1 Tax=Nocardia sp. NBC_00508 TaxID=2975992 RepID=UPI002E80A170|nr:2OG-Fe(II) oxygenase [Nocardia sp. NBC_00508]WUD65529.1 2OG-Fe(II) oxygenase [Nocardia sp. NBC_00508]